MSEEPERTFTAAVVGVTVGLGFGVAFAYQWLTNKCAKCGGALERCETEQGIFYRCLPCRPVAPKMWPSKCQAFKLLVPQTQKRKDELKINFAVPEQPIRVLVCGLRNAGKSTLINSLLRCWAGSRNDVAMNIAGLGTKYEGTLGLWCFAKLSHVKDLEAKAGRIDNLIPFRQGNELNIAFYDVPGLEDGQTREEFDFRTEIVKQCLAEGVVPFKDTYNKKTKIKHFGKEHKIQVVIFVCAADQIFNDKLAAAYQKFKSDLKDSLQPIIVITQAENLSEDWDRHFKPTWMNEDRRNIIFIQNYLYPDGDLKHPGLFSEDDDAREYYLLNILEAIWDRFYQKERVQVDSFKNIQTPDLSQSDVGKQL